MRRLSLPLVCVGLFSSGLTLVSLSALQRQCDDIPLDRQVRIVDDESGDVMDVTDAVYGSASLQGVQGFSADILSCAGLYRYHWFIASFELLACMLGLAACSCRGFYYQIRFGLMGIFAILSVLCIHMTDSFLTASTVSFYREVPQAQQTLHAMITGCISCSTLNILLVLVLGLRTIRGSGTTASGGDPHALGGTCQQYKLPIVL